MSDDLIVWLRAQLDDDERVAREVPESSRTWHTAGGWPETGPDGVADEAGRWIVEEADERDVAHIARWDPAAVLAEVEAKRRTLDLHWPDTIQYVKPKCHECSGCGCCSMDHPCDTVRLLAQQYAGRPGWREEWRV